MGGTETQQARNWKGEWEDTYVVVAFIDVIEAFNVFKIQNDDACVNRIIITEKNCSLEGELSYKLSQTWRCFEKPKKKEKKIVNQPERGERAKTF